MNKFYIAASALLAAASAFAAGPLFLPDGSVSENIGPKTGSPVAQFLNLPRPSADLQASAPRLFAADGSDLKPVSKWYKEDVDDDHINYWVFQCMGVGAFPKGIIHGTTPYSANRDNVCLWGPLEGRNWSAGEFVIDSGCMVGDEYWAYCSESWAQDMTHCPKGIYQIDLTTGERVRLVYDDSENYESYNCVLNEMSYDPVTDYVYGLRKVASGSFGWEISMTMQIVRIDPRNPSRKWEMLGTVDYSLGMACDDGYMYLIRPNTQKSGEKDDEGNDIYEIANCSLFKINLEENASFTQEDLELVGLVNSGFLKINYLQTMEFDHSDHTLWWIGCKDGSGEGFVTTLDVNTAETGDPLFDMVDRVQYVAMAIPYEVADKKAPHYVRNLSYITGTEGAATASFSWTNPSKNTEKTALDEVTGVKVYRDGKLYQTLTSASGAGTAQTWTDKDMTSGFHNYKFVPYNSKGDGLSRSRTIFIGRDVPGAPVDVTVIPNGDKATISWQPSATGANNGWYDKATLKYTVTRLPDNKVVAKDTDQTSVTDQADVFGGYSYTVTPANTDGTGESATSAIVPFGPAVEIPYVNNLETELRANELTVVDNNNDGNKFLYTYSPSDGTSMCWVYDFCAGKPDDWLITPELKLDPAKKYKVTVEYATSNYRDTQELLHIKQGKTSKVSDHKTNLADMIGLSTYYGAYRTEVVTDVDPANGNYISFHVDSEANQGWVVFSRIEVREYSATDVSAVDFLGSELAYVNSENYYQVTVKNEGCEMTRNAVAQIVKEDGTVLAQANAGALRPGETEVVEVAWTPREKGEFTIYGRAHIDGDTFEQDNRYFLGIPVVVGEGVASRWTTVLRQDEYSYQPFYVSLGDCGNTTIYTAAEVGKKNVSLTGVAYTYLKANDTSDEGLKNITVDIYAAETDKLYAAQNDQLVALPELKLMGSAVVDMNGESLKNDITVMFDEPLPFSGEKNLAIQAVATVSSTPNVNPSWAIQNEYGKSENDFRSVYSVGDRAFVCNYPPVLKLGYFDPSGVNSMITLGGLSVKGSVVDFGRRMDVVNVFDFTGRKVLSASAVESLTLPAGLYIVEGRAGSDRVRSKVFIAR